MKCEENVRLMLHCNVVARRSRSWTATVQQVRASKHARRTARASSIDEKGLIVKSKATSAPPRAGTTGIILGPGNGVESPFLLDLGDKGKV